MFHLLPRDSSPCSICSSRLNHHLIWGICCMFSEHRRRKSKSRWWFEISFILTRIPGEMMKFDWRIFFQMGWFNPPTSKLTTRGLPPNAHRQFEAPPWAVQDTIGSSSGHEGGDSTRMMMMMMMGWWVETPHKRLGEN